MKNKLLTTGLAFFALVTFATAQEKLPPNKSDASKTEEQPHDSIYYACVMHTDVTLDKPGNCYKCNMPLEKRVIPRTRPKNPKMEGVKTYTCLTHTDVKSDKPGKCPKCGMDLVVDEKVK